MLRSTFAVAMFLASIVFTIITFFVLIDGSAINQPLLPADCLALLRSFNVICWIGFFVATGRDAVVAHLADNREFINDLYRRADQISLRLDRVNDHLKAISQAIAPYGEERETIGRLAAYTEQLDDEVSKEPTVPLGRVVNGASVIYLHQPDRSADS